MFVCDVLIFLVASLVWTTAPSPYAAVADYAAARPVRIVRCVRYWGEARYRGVGYDHEVHVVNDCTRAALCEVATNVDPHLYDVTVPPGRHVVVITRTGSPARRFAPEVACDFEE